MSERIGRKILLIACNLLGLAAFLWPFVLPAAVGGDAAHEVDAPWILAGLVLCLGPLLFLELGRGGIGPKRVALIGVLAAAMVVLRLPGFIGGYNAMFIIVFVAGNAFGPGFGFLLGSIGMLASALFVGGLGPWVPFQMVAMGWVGMGAGLLPRGRNWPVRIGALIAYGIFVGFAYGAVMNLWSWPYFAGSSDVGWAPQLGAGENLGRYVRFYLVTSLAWDSFRAVGDAVLIALLARPLLGALDRAALRMT